MCEIKINRIYHNEKYTIGKLFLNGVYKCDTIEDIEREVKIMHETCIPKGKYNLIVNMSNRFNRLLPIIQDVKGFEGIRIHNGVDQDSSSGCIIVGENKEKGKLTNSRYWMNYITDVINYDQTRNIKSTIEIV